MNVADVVLAAFVLLLLLVIVGVMRETVILRGQVTALSQLITNPPAPSYLGDRLPAALADRLPSLSASRRAAHAIVFIRPGCSGCEEMITRLEEVIKHKFIDKNDLTFIVAAAPDAPLFRAAQAVSRNTILDPTGAITKACEVRATPTQLAIWTDTAQVFDYMLGGDVEWIRQRTQAQPDLEHAARALA